MKTIFESIMTFFVLIMLCTCGSNNNEKQLKQVVDSFAIAYFNWQFQRAVPYCTPESKVWLQYAASQVHQEDIDILREQMHDATIHISSIQCNDNVGDVVLNVKNYLNMDTIGRPGRKIEDANFHLHLLSVDGKWKVKLNGLPRVYKSK